MPEKSARHFGNDLSGARREFPKCLRPYYEVQRHQEAMQLTASHSILMTRFVQRNTRGERRSPRGFAWRVIRALKPSVKGGGRLRED